MQKVAIIGLGFMGTMHAQIYKQLRDATLVAVVDKQQAKAKRDLAKLGIEAAVFGTLEDMLKKCEVDVVDICLPTDLHAPLALKAIAAGKHLFCEKPLAMNLEQGAEMVSAAKKSGVHLFYAEQLVFAPRYQKIKELIAQNTFGQLVHISHRERHGGPHAKWFRDPAMSGGGVTMDMGIHGIGLIQWLLKPAKITHVYAGFINS